MKRFYKLMGAMLLLTSTAFSASVDKEKTIRKSFPVNASTSVEIKTRYTNVDIKTWDRDSAVFKIMVRAQHKNEETALELAEEIEIRFSESGNYIVAETDFGDESNRLLTGILSFADALTSSKPSLLISYTVYVPNYVPLRIENKYGDIGISDYKGNIKIEHSHGDLRLGDVEGYLDLDLKFADLNANNLKRLNLDVEYGDVVLFKVENADISSKSSKLNIHEAGRIRCRSKRDDYSFYKVQSINSDATYTDFVITELIGNLSFTGKYGNVTIHNVRKGFDKINMNCESSNANISFEDGCAFAVDITLEDGDLSYPQQLKGIQKKNMDDDDDVSVNYFGTVGTTGKANSSLEIFGENTDINLTLK